MHITKNNNGKNSDKVWFIKQEHRNLDLDQALR